MNENLQMWIEILFNIFYLLLIWYFVYQMTVNLKNVKEENKKTASLIRTAFFLLALGDSGHVGFRVVAYAINGLETEINIFGKVMNLTGIGMLSTAVTVTFFYMLLVYIWKNRYKRHLNPAAAFLLISGFIRLILLALPGNDWGSLIPPQPMSLIRNFPLVIQGLGIMVLLLISARQNKDKPFILISWMISISFAFYFPVILFAQKFPLIGMLMIPKTIAYLIIAIIAYRNLWKTAPLPVSGQAQNI